MKRLTDRISAAFAGTKCPGCGRYVVPTEIAQQGPATPTETGKRWSFIWLPPRGLMCPECQFPLSRYAGRTKWIRLLSAGVALVAIAAVLFVLRMMGDVPPLVDWIAIVTAAVGVPALLLGAVGIIVGGRHGPI